MTPDPLILAFDTSARHCTAAVVRGDAVLAHKHENMAKGQAERLMGFIAETLTDAGIILEDIDAIGVGIGPGNFTGIRIGISAARGLALGLGRPAIGVSGFDALQLGQEGPCVCVIDAPRDEVYLQACAATGVKSDPQMLHACDIPRGKGELLGTRGQTPAFPQAVAIALLTGQRYQTELEKPAPLYIRAADAAPARDSSPLVLP